MTKSVRRHSTHRVGPHDRVRRSKVIADVEGRTPRLDDRVSSSVGSGLEDGLSTGGGEGLEVAPKRGRDAVVDFG